MILLVLKYSALQEGGNLIVYPNFWKCHTEIAITLEEYVEET